MKNKISLLKDYFQKRPEVTFAFLFGSQAKKISGKISDWDIAVYFKPKENLEWEEAEREYPQENEIWNDLIDSLKTDDVDLIVLNRAPSNIAAAAIKGIPLILRDRRIFLEFMLIVTREAEDLRITVQEYAGIYWRSLSLCDEDKDVITRRLIFLDSELNDAPRFERLTKDEYEKDSSKRRDVERWIENLVNATTDISKVLLASQKKTAPSSYREILQDIDFLANFPGNLGKQLSKYAELRNILAHEYLDIRWKHIEEFVKSGPNLLYKFIETVKEFIK